MGVEVEKEAPVALETETISEVKNVAEAVQNDVTDATADIETRAVKLEGRTIATDGKQQYVTIDVDGLQDKLSIDDSSGLKMTDDLGNEISSTESENVVWGHWKDNTDKKWVAGKTTDASSLDKLRDDTKTVNAQYTGKVMGSVNGNDNIKMDSTNAVNVNFELGGGKNNMDGSMNFETQTGKNWDNTFSGSTSGSKFSSDTVGGTATSGTVDGSFYGSQAEAVGGTFDLDNAGGDKATGVFKADKQ